MCPVKLCYLTASVGFEAAFSIKTFGVLVSEEDVEVSIVITSSAIAPVTLNDNNPPNKIIIKYFMTVLLLLFRHR